MVTCGTHAGQPSLRIGKPFLHITERSFASGMRKSAMHVSLDVSLPVLVVDDFRTMTTIISKLVREVGFTEIDQVNDGPSALERLREKKYGLVLSDWDMRPMNGTELIQQIRKEPLNSGTLVIMITAKGDADVSWLSGADGYLTKPFKAPELRDKIEEVVSQRADSIPLAG
jgi:two-component system, chemotaxis family, chemotaxis protein CheY